MTTRNLLSSLFIICCGLLAGCSDSNQPGSGDPTTFPMKPGTYWKYATVDSVHGPGISVIYDTVTATVSGSVTMANGQSGSRLVYSYGSRENDTQYIAVCTTLDTVFYYDNIDAQFVLDSYPLPLSAGKSWPRAYAVDLRDSCIVQALESVIVPAGAFSDCARVYDAHLIGIMVNSNRLTWIKPGIGIVKMRRDFSAFDGPISNWTLLSYSIAK